jgi:hypothetical protein
MDCVGDEVGNAIHRVAAEREGFSRKIIVADGDGGEGVAVGEGIVADSF